MQEQSALTRLPSIVATSTSEHSGEKPAKSNFTAVKVRPSTIANREKLAKAHALSFLQTRPRDPKVN